MGLWIVSFHTDRILPVNCRAKKDLRADLLLILFYPPTNARDDAFLLVTPSRGCGGGGERPAFVRGGYPRGEAEPP